MSCLHTHQTPLFNIRKLLTKIQQQIVLMPPFSASTLVLLSSSRALRHRFRGSRALYHVTYGRQGGCRAPCGTHATQPTPSTTQRTIRSTQNMDKRTRTNDTISVRVLRWYARTCTSTSRFWTYVPQGARSGHLLLYAPSQADLAGHLWEIIVFRPRQRRGSLSGSERLQLTIQRQARTRPRPQRRHHRPHRRLYRKSIGSGPAGCTTRRSKRSSRRRKVQAGQPLRPAVRAARDIGGVLENSER